MNDRNTVEISGTNPATSITFVIDDGVISDEQQEGISEILRDAEQQILRYLGRAPKYAANAVTEDRIWGY